MKDGIDAELGEFHRLLRASANSVNHHPAIEEGDLAPVGVFGGAASAWTAAIAAWTLEGSGVVDAEGPVDEADAFIDLRPIPEAAVLLVEDEDIPPRRWCGRPAGNRWRRTRAEQSHHFRLVRHQLEQQAGQAQRLITEVSAHEAGRGGAE